MSIVVIQPNEQDKYTGARVDPAALEVGDRVAWLSSSHYRGTEAVLAVVSRITPTQIVVKTTTRSLEYRFDRRTGLRRGGWDRLIDANDPRVVIARTLAVARNTIRDVETLASNSKGRDVDTLTGELENMRTVINAGLDRMAKLLTSNPNSLMEEHQS